MKGRQRKPEYCPECGGELDWKIPSRSFICTSCGLQLSSQELIEYRERLKREQDKNKNRVKEYVKWWLSSKKEKER